MSVKPNSLTEIWMYIFHVSCQSCNVNVANMTQNSSKSLILNSHTLSWIMFSPIHYFFKQMSHPCCCPVCSSSRSSSSFICLGLMVYSFHLYHVSIVFALWSTSISRTRAQKL